MRRPALAIWRRNALVWRKLIGPSVVINFGEPFLYILGLGYGLKDTRLLVSRLGDAAVREILLTARLFSADEALRLGIVNKVTAADALDAAVDEYAQQIAANAPLTLKASKAIIHEAGKAHSESNEALCKQLVDDCFSSEDYAEGRRAFAEKRRPQFTGQ